MNTLFVTCDDCGLSEGINQATLKLHERGMAQCASMLANFPATRHALELFRGVPSFGVGVHLNLTDGFPLTAPEANAGLTRADGGFGAMLPLLWRSLHHSPSLLAAAETELRAQVNVVVQAGLPLHHLSTHLQFHLAPALRVIVLRLAEAYHVPWVRPWRLRATIMPVNPLLDRRIPSAVGRSAPDYLAVVKYWLGLPPSALAHALAAVPGNVELVVHPGVEQDHTFPAGVHHSPRERQSETQYLERCWPLLMRAGHKG